MGSAALPSVSAELVAHSWSVRATTQSTANNQASFGNAPSISLENVSYDFGTFVNKFIEPILNEIAPVLQPIEQALAVFDTPLSFLGGGTIDGGNDGLLGTLWHQLDVAGAVDASGNDIPDGQITLVDLLKLATGANLAPMVNFLTTVTDIVQWATALSGSNVGSAMTYDLGSFSIPNDIRAANFDISQIAPAITGGQDLSTFLAGLSNPPAPGATPTAAQALQALLNPSASSLLSFPIISNPASALQFLLGGTADLFDANFLVTPVSFGSIDPATGNPTSLVNVVPPINLSPIPLVNFDLTLQAALQATIGLNFGYDTSGLTAFKNSDFADPSKILNGLFVEDPIQNGVTEPVAQISGAVQLGVEASAIIASIGGGGNIGGSMSLSFSQPGKNYLNVLANKISNQGALSIFDASGRVTAGFQAVVKALGSTLWTYNSPRITLATFDTGSGNAGSGIPNATTWVGPVGGDFETKANWNPTFANLNGTVYYGDATIGQNTTANFAGQLPADLASLIAGDGQRRQPDEGQIHPRRNIDRSHQQRHHRGQWGSRPRGQRFGEERWRHHRRLCHRTRRRAGSGDHSRRAYAIIWWRQRHPVRRDHQPLAGHRHEPIAVEPRQHDQRRRNDQPADAEPGRDECQRHQAAGAHRRGNHQSRTAGGNRQRQGRRRRTNRRSFNPIDRPERWWNDSGA